MCGCSDIIVGDVKVWLFIGDYPGCIGANGIKYKTHNVDGSVSELVKNRGAVKKELSKLSKDDLVEAFVLLAENGEEG